jgi:hypothetical protein
MSAYIKGDEIFASLPSKLDQLRVEFANEALERVKSYTPVHTGHLQESWSVTFEGSEIEIANNARNKYGELYGVWVEYGTAHTHGFFMAHRTIAEAEQILAVARQKCGL